MALQICVQVGRIGVAHISKIRMSTGTKSGVLTQRPVLKIVAGGMAGAGKVGDFILFIAALAQVLHRVEIHLRLRFVIG